MSIQERGDHILFIGFMGSGKTTVSKRLCAMTDLSLIDIDYRIECLQHKKIPEIFEQEGEAGFRRIETETLKGIARESRSIVSCGGGIVCNPENVKILKDLGTVIYLKVSLEEAISRISRPETRPMLSGKRPVEQIYQERLALYQQAADIEVETEGLSIHRATLLVKETLEKRGIL